MSAHATLTKAQLEAKLHEAEKALDKATKDAIKQTDKISELEGQLEDYRADNKSLEAQLSTETAEPNEKQTSRGECIPHGYLQVSPSLVAQCVGVMRDRVSNTPLSQKELDHYLDDYICQGIMLAEGICKKMQENAKVNSTDQE